MNIDKEQPTTDQRDDALTNDPNQEISAEQRVNQFLFQLTTPNTGKPTKKIKFASKSRTVQAANERLLGHKTRNKENVKPMDSIKKDNTTNASMKRGNGTTNQCRTRQRVPHPSASVNTAVSVFKAPKPKPPAVNGINSKLPKTAAARPNHGGNHHPNRSARNHSKSKSNSSKSSLSPPTQTQQQPAIDQYSLSLQIKNAECESLKKENKELKEQNEALVDTEKEHQFCKRDILNLHEESRTDKDRICKLERKLESCGIDSVALQSPAFMNEDTQKHIIFWRERLFKARERLNDRKLKQKEMIRTAQHYIEGLQS